MIRYQQLIDELAETRSALEKSGQLVRTLTAANAHLEKQLAENVAQGSITNQKLTEQYEELSQIERNARLNAEMQSVLREIAEAAILSPSLDDLYALVHRELARVLPAKLFHINLLDEATGEIVVPFRNDELNFFPERRPLGKGMTEYTMRMGHTVNVTPAEMERLRDAGEYMLGSIQNVQARHYLGAPLINPQGKPFGVLSLIQMGETASFHQENVDTLSIIASQVAMAIERKRMENELTRQATIDELSGLSNRRHFLAQAALVLVRAGRYGRACSLLMIDIDHFKLVNDRFGHATGDLAIQRVARLCVESMRDADLCGRIGGEEFVMLLVETDISAAMQVAQRVRKQIENAPFGTEQGIPCPLRVSIGVAEFQSVAEGITDVMGRADAALYRAKQEGRNKVVCG